MGQLELATLFTPRPSLGRHRDSSVARTLKREIVSRWQAGEPADAAAVLAAHSELSANRALALDLVYEEYCLRLEGGEEVALDEFCGRFPEYADSFRKLIETDEYFRQHPHLWTDAETEQKWPEPGQAFLNFKLLKELGRGTFARVFLAAEPALGNRHVVVKVAHRGASEAQTLGRLNHPNIVPVYSVQTEAETGWSAVCMPYLGNATLVDVIRRAFSNSALPATAEVIVQAARSPRQPAPSAELPEKPDPALRRASYVEGIVHLGVQLADALACTHAQGICHLDLKPSNVLLRPDGRPMLLDFNLSRDQHLHACIVGGTLPYMSPEQLRALETDGCELHAGSDIFSLGVILYELLTGSLPFGAMSGSAKDLRALLRSKQERGPKPLCDLNPQVDRRLADVIERCLAVDPAGRPASAAELSAALAQFLSTGARMRRWARTHSRGLLGTALVLLLAAAAGGQGLASRAPYAERRFEEGRQAYLRGHYEVALEHFDEALRDRPDMTKAEFARGRTFQKLGKLDEAILIYYRLSKDRKDSRAFACLGFCHLARGHSNWALHYLKLAADSDDATAETYNNLGYCYRLGSKHEEWDKAEAALRRACELKPNMVEARENLLLLHLRRSAQASKLARRGGDVNELISSIWNQDVESALTVPNATADLYLAAARLLACMSSIEADAKHARRALECLDHAVSRGCSVEALKDSTFTSVVDAPEFQALVRKAAARPKQPWNASVVDPVPLALH